MKKNKFKILLLLTLSFIFAAGNAKALTFDPDNIIGDQEILDTSSMSQDDIQGFLEEKDSPLATYSTANPDGKMMKASEIIYDRATTNGVNPKFLIVLLQKEQSLIEDPSPSQSQLDWACGYGCPDGSSCNARWKGLWKQLNSASLQFRDYMDNPQLYTYKVGQTYTLTNTGQDPMAVTPANQATAALYNYTPHVYNGNFNFFKIWHRYFTRDYPDGSLMQARGEPGVWLIQNGFKRPFLSRNALISRFDPNKILIVNKSDLDKYEKGAPIRFPQYSLIRSPRGTIFLLVDDKRRGFTSGLAFKKMGFNPDEIMDASWEDINAYQEGLPITATSTYPTGALLQDKKTGGVYWVDEGTKAPILDAIFLKTKFKNKKIIPVTEEELASYQTVSPVLFDDGELLKSSLSSDVFVISGGKKRAITSGDVFKDLGYKWENILTVSPKILYLYDNGEPLTKENSNSDEINLKQ